MKSTALTCMKGVNLFSVKRLTRHVFPTAESPNTITLRSSLDPMIGRRVCRNDRKHTRCAREAREVQARHAKETNVGPALFFFFYPLVSSLDLFENVTIPECI